MEKRIVTKPSEFSSCGQEYSFLVLAPFHALEKKAAVVRSIRSALAQHYSAS